VKTSAGIAIAGAAGALSRYAVEGIVSRRMSGAFPWGTMVVNLSGAFLVGFLFTVLAERFLVAPWLRSTLLIGFLGAYTTFSTLSLETLRLAQDGARLLALANGAGTLVAGLIAVYAGVVLGRAI